MSPSEETLAAAGSDAARADWPSKAAGQVETLVSAIRDKTVNPVLSIAQVVVFGLIALFMLLVLTVVLSVAILRLLDVLLFHRHVWASYTVLGGIFSLLGLLLLSRRNKAT
jgi:hypothetical protein